MTKAVKRKFRCIVCDHKHRKRIEKEYILGVTLKKLSEKYLINDRTISRHVKGHLPQSVVNDRINRMPELKLNGPPISSEIPSMINLKECIEYIHTETLEIHRKAKKRGQHNVSLKALRQDLDCVSLVLRAKELLYRHENQEQWEGTLSKILTVLSKFKGAKEAISVELYNDFGGDDLVNYSKKKEFN